MLHEYATALAAAKTRPELVRILDALSASAGFSQYRFALRLPTRSLGKPHLLIFSHCDPAWIDLYRQERMAMQDPILYLAMQQNAPIEWHALTDETALPPNARYVMAQAASFGLCNGLSFPLRGPNGESGVFSFITEDPSLDVSRYKAELLLAVNVVMDAALRICCPPRQKHPLSEREIECLFWAAEGKTSLEIAVILSISESTTNFHLKNAIVKLGASNRTHAIIVASMAGLLQPQLVGAEIEDHVCGLAVSR